MEDYKLLIDNQGIMPHNCTAKGGRRRSTTKRINRKIRKSIVHSQHNKYRKITKALGGIAAEELNNAPLEPETKEHRSLSLLKHINRMGFITADSQDGIIKHGKKVVLDVKLFHKCFHKAYDGLLKTDNYTPADEKRAQRKWMEYYKESGGKYGTGTYMSQRAYLEGVMDKDNADIFVYILNRTDKIAWTTRIPVTYSTGSNTGPLQSRIIYDRLNDVPVISTSLSANNNRDAKTLLYEVLPRNAYDKINASVFKHLVIVQCLDPMHGRSVTGKHGLFSDVLQALRETDKR